MVIARDAGEGRNITVRGLGLDFTRVRINGIEALATTGGTDSSGGNNRTRGFDFNVFAAKLFSTVIVRKSSSADVDEGSLGATVDLVSSKPFDFPGFVATASLQGRYNDLSREVDPRTAFLISNTFADRKVGILISGAYSKRRLFEEGSDGALDNGPSSGGWARPIGVREHGKPRRGHVRSGRPGVVRIAGRPRPLTHTTRRATPPIPSALDRYGRLRTPGPPRNHRRAPGRTLPTRCHRDCCIRS